MHWHLPLGIKIGFGVTTGLVCGVGGLTGFTCWLGGFTGVGGEGEGGKGWFAFDFGNKVSETVFPNLFI